MLNNLSRVSQPVGFRDNFSISAFDTCRVNVLYTVSFMSRSKSKPQICFRIILHDSFLLLTLCLSDFFQCGAGPACCWCWPKPWRQFQQCLQDCQGAGNPFFGRWGRATLLFWALSSLWLPSSLALCQFYQQLRVRACKSLSSGNSRRTQKSWNRWL